MSFEVELPVNATQSWPLNTVSDGADQLFCCMYVANQFTPLSSVVATITLWSGSGSV
jgi:hypothetical protein